MLLVMERKCLETRERDSKLRWSVSRNRIIHSQHSLGKYKSAAATIVVLLSRIEGVSLPFHIVDGERIEDGL